MASTNVKVDINGTMETFQTDKKSIAGDIVVLLQQKGMQKDGYLLYHSTQEEPVSLQAF